MILRLKQQGFSSGVLKDYRNYVVGLINIKGESEAVEFVLKTVEGAEKC